jgi:DNA-binding response OmpR family regulator
MMFGQRTRVLVVDDEPSICRALQIALGRLGHEVVTTESGEVALTLLRAEHFDCLLVDLRIPDLRGDVLFELAASIQPQLRRQTLFITGDQSVKGTELVEACGCPHVPKPFDLREVTGIVERLTRRARGATA